MWYKGIRSYLGLPDYVSLLGVVFSMLGVFFSLKGDFPVAAVLLIIATVMDGIDGRIARLLRKEGKVGAEIDNLCDTVNVAAVAVFGYTLGLQSKFAMIVLILFVVAGVMRLVRFSVTGTLEGYYEGIPVTCSVTIPILYFIFSYFNLAFEHLVWFYLAYALLMISTIRIKKV